MYNYYFMILKIDYCFILKNLSFILEDYQLLTYYFGDGNF